jgi:hypothetical protein
LFAYQHFYYRLQGKRDPLLVALFSEAVGDASTELLSSLGIEAIWLEAGDWHTSNSSNDSLLRQVIES